ncbi:MAG: AMP-binding protein [Myxococcales bacterium]|nr:AMP-binding protein [Myxococcales bacterium]
MIRPLPALLLEHATERPQDVALRHKQLGIWRQISWAEYRDRVASTAHALRALGVGPGDAVAILSDNRPEWLYADLAAQALGALSVGIYQTNPAPDVAYILSHAKVKVLVCEDQEQVDKAIAVAEDTPSVTAVLCVETRGTRDYDDPRLHSWEEVIAEGAAAHERDPAWFDELVSQQDPDAPSMVVYTSGTTGPPKGAMLTARNALAVMDGLTDRLGATPQDLILSYLPLCHVAEKIYTVYIPLSVGCVVHFGESIETVEHDLAEVSPTIFLGVPRIWEKMHAKVTLRMQDSSWLKRRLYDWFLSRTLTHWHPDRDGRSNSGWHRLVRFAGDLFVFRSLQEHLGLRRCRLPSSGAAPIAPDLLCWFHAVGIPVREGYGMTECAGGTHFNLPGSNRLGTVGSTLEPLVTRIADDGEVLIHGPAVFAGYLHNEAATKEAIDEDGWYHTGDIGTVDEDGFLSITGRKKEIIITAGGKNLSPEKIENALKLSPYVKEAVAIGDARKFISALVQIDADAVGDWATRRSVTYTDFEDLTRRPEVVSLVEQEIRKANDQLARVEHVRAFRLFPKELHQDDGELTPTQKVRRRNIGEIWGHLVEEIYG